MNQIIDKGDKVRLKIPNSPLMMVIDHPHGNFCMCFWFDASGAPHERQFAMNLLYKPEGEQS